MRWSYIRTPALTGGSMGLTVPPAELFGWVLESETQKFYVFLVIVVVLVVAVSRILESRIGRAFLSIKNDERAAAAMAVPTGRYFVLAFALSGFVVGVGGSMYAALVGHLSPESFDLVQLILHFAIIMVGGLGSLVGSILGAVLITATPELFRDWPGFEELHVRNRDRARHPVPAPRPRKPPCEGPPDLQGSVSQGGLTWPCSKSPARASSSAASPR